MDEIAVTRRPVGELLLITDFDTPRNGNLGDVHADSALEEPRRATK